MNAYEDVIRRIHFMTAEIDRIGHDLSQYGIIMGRRLFVDVMDSAPAEFRDEHHQRQAYLFGYRLRLVDRPGGYLALLHEVQG